MNALHSEKKISDEQLQICYVEKCTKLSFILMAIASIILGTVIIVDKLYIYLAGLLVGEFLIFFCLSPYPIGFFNSVHRELREQAAAVGLFISCALGAFPSPVFTGILFQFVGFRWGMLVAVEWL